MNGVASREATVAQDNLFCALGGGTVDGEDLIHDAQYGVERKLNVVTTVDRSVTVQNLLENFSIRDQALALAHEAFQYALRVRFLKTWRTHEVHGDVGIDENHSG
jgi:hypothetical protein